DIYAPVSGEIVAVNDALSDSPELVNSEPYAGGWIFKIKASDENPSLGYVLSKGKDIEGVGSEDLVNYIDVGATYYFNKNMSAFVD
ncbi:porin, partial [Salmonella enterica subsp. enterica serovar Montevideo]|nr:porin [Salmonella enterica subsp. enterica serovar Montevideo]